MQGALAALRKVNFDWTAHIDQIWRDQPHETESLQADSRRELIERLAVRLSSEIVQLQWSKTTPAPDSSPSSEASVPNGTHHGQTFLVHFAPAIDLRFYF